MAQPVARLPVTDQHVEVVNVHHPPHDPNLAKECRNKDYNQEEEKNDEEDDERTQSLSLWSLTYMLPL